MSVVISNRLDNVAATRTGEGPEDRSAERPQDPDTASVITERPLHVVTPLLKSRKFSDKVGANVWLKLESVQNSGSFKLRGIGHFCKKVCECGVHVSG